MTMSPEGARPGPARRPWRTAITLSCREFPGQDGMNIPTLAVAIKVWSEIAVSRPARAVIKF